MKIQYDKVSDALYVYLKKGKIAKTTKMTNRLVVDSDKNGKIIGLEILGISSHIPKKDIGKIQMEMPVFSAEAIC
jgi:uncharacterized protein YuzE